MTPPGIELPNYRFVAQHLNHCATVVPVFKSKYVNCTTRIWQRAAERCKVLEGFYNNVVLFK
jgi:hypothetical protein